MCFYLTKGEKAEKAEIAKKNITVYKIIYNNNFPIYGKLIIDGKREFWKKGFHYTETDFPKIALTESISENAFHSYMTLFRAQNVIFGINKKIVKMIIPKGAYYYKNKNYGEYISSDIIYVKDI